MSTARYLIAKYVPDLWRMEPRNIGVIVWSPDGVAARFVGERSDRPGKVDGRRIPKDVNSPNAYIQWVQHWRSVMQQEELRPITGGSPVSHSSPGFVEVLKETGRGNYLLAEGGALLDQISSEGLPDLANYVYNILVEPSGTTEEGYESPLEGYCEDLIREARLDTDPNFRRQLLLPCQVPGSPVEDPLVFSYGYQNGSLQRVYQRVELPRQEEAISRNVHNAAWMFSTAVRAQQIRPELSAALIYLPDSRRTDAAMTKWFSVLRAIVPKVIDVADTTAALQEFQELARLGPH